MLPQLFPHGHKSYLPMFGNEIQELGFKNFNVPLQARNLGSLSRWTWHAVRIIGFHTKIIGAVTARWSCLCITVIVACILMDFSLSFFYVISDSTQIWREIFINDLQCPERNWEKNSSNANPSSSLVSFCLTKANQNQHISLNLHHAITLFV